MQHGDLYEVCCNSSIETCESRDVKVLYKKARDGEIPIFTGIASPYAAPEKPEREIKTDQLFLDDSVDQLITLLKQCGIVNN